MPPMGMPMVFNSAPRYTVCSPRAVSDFTHSGLSFLSAGTSLSKSSRVNGPAMMGSRVNVSPAATNAEVFRKLRRLSANFSGADIVS